MPEPTFYIVRSLQYKCQIVKNKIVISMTFEVIFGVGCSTASWPRCDIVPFHCACLQALPECSSFHQPRCYCRLFKVEQDRASGHFYKKNRTILIRKINAVYSQWL